MQNQHQDIHTFQQNNVRAHTAYATTQYLANNNVPLFEWPALFSDLLPIEHLSVYLGERISQMNKVRDLEKTLQQEKNAIPLKTIRRLIGSMRRRCMACVAAHVFNV